MSCLPSDVDAGGGLIEEHHIGAPDDGERKAEALLFAPRERPPRCPRPVGETDEFEQFAGVARAVVEGSEQPQRLDGTNGAVQPAGLQHHADAPGERRVIANRIEPADPDRSVRRRPVSLEAIDGRGLARPVRAEDGGDGAGLGGEAHAIDGMNVAVAHVEVLDFHDGHGGERYPRGDRPDDAPPSNSARSAATDSAT
jgi:hypothetical protein